MKKDDVSSASLDFGHHYGSWKIKKAFVLHKSLIFKPFQPKNTSLTPLEQLQTNSLAQNTQKRFKKLEIKHVSFGFLSLDMFLQATLRL
jgi:hypothetical protein